MKIGYLMQVGVPDVRQRPLSGPANHVKSVFDQLVERGHRLCLLASLNGRIWKSENLENFEPVTVSIADAKPSRIFERGVRRVQSELQFPYAALFESLRFALACKQELAGYDLLYERMGWVGYGGGLAARWLDLPLVMEINGDHLNELEMQGIAPRGAQLWLSKFLMKRAVAMAFHTVATGEGWRRRYIERWGAKPENVTVVESGSELVSLLNRNQLHSFCQNSDNVDSITTIAYSGGFDAWQGVTILIRAFARVIADRMPMRLLLIGSGREAKSAAQLVSDLHLESYVTFTGQLEASCYAQTLARADIGVSPYCGRVEYSGLKLLDYKAAGLATIASGQGTEPTVIRNEETGLIVPPCDEEALYAALARLGGDVELRKRMGRAARIEAERMHGWNNTAENLEKLFAQVVQVYGEHRN